MSGARDEERLKTGAARRVILVLHRFISYHAINLLFFNPASSCKVPPPAMDSHLQSSPAQLAIDSQIAHLQAELTTHIARTKATICALYEQRNALSPMSRLPEELLCQIYFALQQHRDPQGLRGWKVVTAVSRAWRAAAMASPSLWATVDCGYTSLKDADIAFERSGSSGLRIRGWLQSRDVRWCVYHSVACI